MRNVRFSLSLLVGAAALAVLLAGGAQAAPTPKPRTKAARTHAKIAAAQADAIALRKFPGKVVGKTKLENEEGIWQYGVMVQSGKTLREVMVNAKTGKIDSVEVTNAKTERKEAAAEPKAGPKGKAPAHPAAKHAPRAKTKTTAPERGK